MNVPASLLILLTSQSRGSVMQGCMWILTRYNKQLLSPLFSVWSNKSEAVSHFPTFIRTLWKLIFSAYFLGKKKTLYASMASQNDAMSLGFAGLWHILSSFSEEPHFELAFLPPAPITQSPIHTQRFLGEGKSPNPSWCPVESQVQLRAKQQKETTKQCDKEDQPEEPPQLTPCSNIKHGTHGH